MMRSEFEDSIKRSVSYEKLVYQHGERLFIFDDGKYKIAAVQLACEIFQEKQTEVDELTLQVAEMKSRLNDAYTDGQSAMYAARQSKIDELQKRVDFTLKVVQSMRNEVKHGHLSDDESQTLSSYANDLEQALKGDHA